MEAGTKGQTFGDRLQTKGSKHSMNFLCVLISIFQPNERPLARNAEFSKWFVMPILLHILVRHVLLIVMGFMGYVHPLACTIQVRVQ